MTGPSDRLDALVEALRAAAPAATVARDVPLATLTTMRVGGPADVLVSVASASDAVTVARLARANGRAGDDPRRRIQRHRG